MIQMSPLRSSPGTLRRKTIWRPSGDQPAGVVAIAARQDGAPAAVGVHHRDLQHVAGAGGPTRKATREPPGDHDACASSTPGVAVSGGSAEPSGRTVSRSRPLERTMRRSAPANAAAAGAAGRARARRCGGSVQPHDPRLRRSWLRSLMTSPTVHERRLPWSRDRRRGAGPREDVRQRPRRPARARRRRHRGARRRARGRHRALGLGQVDAAAPPGRARPARGRHHRGRRPPPGRPPRARARPACAATTSASSSRPTTSSPS